MKRFGLIFILMFIVSACGQAPTPSATPDMQSTAAAVANTMVAGTLTAMPTATLAPSATPMPTATPTIAPTDTLAPTDAPTANGGAVATAVPGATQAAGPQVTPTMFFGTTTAGNTNNMTPAYLLIQNLSGEKVVYVTLTCNSSKGAVITYNVSVTKSTALTYVVCSYNVLVQIPNKRFMSTSFNQTNKDKSTLSIYLTKLAVHGP